MLKKFAIWITVLCLGVTGICVNPLNVSAEEGMEETDSSELLTEGTIIGYMDGQTKGVYLSSGYSIIRDAGGGKIVAGGGTNATTYCKVTLNVIVERLDGGNWKRVTSWVASAPSDMAVMSSKVLSVGSGYYYRVRCLHSANSDASSSMTSSLLM